MMIIKLIFLFSINIMILPKPEKSITVNMYKVNAKYLTRLLYKVTISIISCMHFACF